MKALQIDLEALLKESGASLAGYGSLADVAAAVNAGFRGAVSIGVALDPAIVRELAQGPTVAYHQEYHRINGLLDQLDLLAADWLVSKGFEAHPLTRENVAIDWQAMQTQLPHKTAARLAGHGWIGRSALLVTPQYGPAIRFSTVLTNAAFQPGPIRADGCGSCRCCKDACPAGAIAGMPWNSELKRASYYDAFACKALAEESCSKIGVQNNICGICIHACPYTQKYLRVEALKLTD